MPSVREPKVAVLEAFLTFVHLFKDLKQVRIATMGGKGAEAQHWKQAGIPGENGWLIERNKSRSTHLVGSDLPYRVHSSLKSLPRVFASIYGPGAVLDAFHLDLCGMLEAQSDAFRPVLPLVLEGGDAAGRCLAVTVADMRRNTSVERFRDVWYRSFALIGPQRAQALLKTMKAEQRAMPRSERVVPHQESMNPEKAARREFSLFVEIGELLRDLPFLPSGMVRYAYVSRMSGSPFRMRTYFFHFERRGLAPLQRSQQLAELWIASPLSFVTETGMVPVNIVREPVLTKETIMPIDPYLNLRQLVEHASDAAKEQFAKLASATGDTSKAQVERDAAVKEVGELRGELTALKQRLSEMAAGILAGGGESRPAAAVPQARPRRPANLNGSAVAHADALTAEAKNIRVQMDLLRALATKDAAKLEEAKMAARRTLGVTRKSNAGNIVGALQARTGGKFRGNFVRRAMEALGKVDTLLPELVELYGKIDGLPITQNQLEREALQAKRKDQ
ncbi:hypothetical protein A2856_00435 [Candidatus Uhrbacteria bacterium RIFCSPHIGHO2_01_FULL_63_20]|uniref:Uncharacterized protein n=1 Tax=Candidatus Uhrbacteria bacterium RIFCSPHIGHO2_01_FULL_63_20 TaxID=1802385 RepID=A0A1F7TLT6_9BACT|nr:MAG: hypothetical protein A2856_00435 [Candidatus Uhrbacteria bacterium RIFCSPHIGHO2_01_FULL_63_20]